MRVNTNGIALSTIGQLNLSEVTRLQGRSLDKLSTGYKINSAQDNVNLPDKSGQGLKSVNLKDQTDNVSISSEALKAYSENVVKDKSMTKDSDMAVETSTYSSSNILVQTGTSLLSQANQRSDTILQLLR